MTIQLFLRGRLSRSRHVLDTANQRSQGLSSWLLYGVLLCDMLAVVVFAEATVALNLE